MPERKIKFSLRTVILLEIFLDLLFIIAADLVSFIIRFNGRFPEVNFDAYLNLAFFIIISRITSFYIFHLYGRPKAESNFEVLINTVKAGTVSSIIVIFVLYFLSIGSYPRSIAFLSWLLTIIFISGWRILTKIFLSIYLGKHFFRAHLLIIGAGNEAAEISSHALRDAAIDYKLIGFIKTGEPISPLLEKERILGTLDDIQNIIKIFPVDEVIIADSSLDKNKISDLIRTLNKEKISFKSVPEAYETVISNAILYSQSIPFVGPSSLFTKSASWYWSLKRILDIASASIMLLLLLPVIVIVMLLIKITSPGPILYLQKRVGRNGRNFVMYKFRTMRLGAEKGRPLWAREVDMRITRLGKFLRRFRIDELPQLVNVLKNDMSLIGPRPERRYFVNKLMKKIPFYVERLQVKPGITGWAQVNFRYAASAEESEEKLIYDLFYIQNMSFALDLLIALKTLKVLLTGAGAH